MSNFKFIILLTVAFVLFGCGGAEERKEVYLEKAKQSLEAGNLEKARIELKNVLQIDPKSGQAHFQLGGIFDQQKEYKKAFVKFLKAAELEPENLEYQARIGTYFLMLAGDIDAAIEKRDLILGKDYSNVDGLLLKAGILLKQNDKISAEKISYDIFVKKPEHIHNAILLSSIYNSDKKYEDAIKVLKTCIDKNSENRQLSSILAGTYLKAGRYDLAEDVYRKFLENNPDDFSNHLRLALLYSEIGDMSKAEAVLHRAIELDSEDIDRKIALINLIQHGRSNQAAIDALKIIVSENKSLGALRILLAELYMTDNKLSEAQNVLEETVSDFSEESAGIKARVYLANIYMQDNNVKAATDVINTAMKISPKDGEVNFVKAKLHLVDKDYDSAINSLRGVLSDDPSNIDAYLLLSASHKANGNIKQADEVINKAYENNRTSASALIALANYYEANNNKAKLEKIVDNYLSIDANNYVMLSYKTVLLNEKKLFSEAEVLASKMITLFPDMENGYIHSVPYLYAEGRIDNAINLLEVGYEKVKENSHIFDLLLSLYIDNRDFQLAENKITSAIKEYGETAKLYMLMANVQKASGNVDAATSNLNRAIEIDPSWSDPYLVLAGIYEADNQITKAINILQQGLAELEGDLKLSLSLAKIFENSGNFGDAIKVYNIAVEKYTGNIVLINNLAVLLSEHGDNENDLIRAKNLADKLKHENQPVVLDTVGWVYYKTGDYVDAVTVLSVVVDRMPEVPLFNYHLGMALYKSGNQVEAKKYLTRALANSGDFPGRSDAETLLRKL